MGRSARSGREAHGSQARDGERLTTIRAAVEYDGTQFFGFQYQPTVRSVAGELESALSRLFAETVKITGAGRTDTGVHASGQVISFSTARPFPFERLAIACNANLPDDLSIRDVTVVDSEFSARFSALARTYVYAILHRKDRSALLAHRAYHVYGRLDVDAMRDGARHLIGEHDFRSVCGTLPDGGVTTRIVRSLDITEHGDLLRVQISADGFLHRMVRTIVGTLVECGLGRRDAGTMPQILAARDRRAAGLTAPPHGLYLAGVQYRDGYDSFAEPPVFTRERL
ncbi:MAG TPA: tRNA pseudouridine(38-40) synthase TruA [Candidatus Aquilonibacter sp.]|nr:tRNA pseudouridine(38-40) synthase TruA [Candidatus Aquilonibacter sp.]